MCNLKPPHKPISEFDETMGGKQKRAAKYKRWMKSHAKPTSSDPESTNEEKTDSSDHHDAHDGSGDHIPQSQPIPLKVRQEVLKHRSKKKAKEKRGCGNWFSAQVDHFSRFIENWPSWPITVIVMIILYFVIFFIIRNLIQLFVPADYGELDRAALYTGLKNAAPKPIYKMIRLMDYLFTSKELSKQGIYQILFPPEDYQSYVPRRQFQVK